MANASISCFRLTLIVTILFGLSVGALASNITYFTPPGSVDGAGEPVDAVAMLSTGSGTIMVTLSNLQANPKSVGENLSDLFFTLSTDLTGSASIGMQVGTEITVHTGGSFTVGSAVAPDWGVSSGVNTIDLDLLGTPEAPIHTIIGPPGATGYTDANGSIAGNPAHNPFIDGTATWTINAPGVTADTTIPRLTFSFGTHAGDNIPGRVSGVTPEISSLLLMGTGVLGLGGILRRKLLHSRKQQANNEATSLLPAVEA